MTSAIPPHVAIIAAAILRLKRPAKLSEIYREVARINITWPDEYKDEESFQGAIRSTIEAHCPQSEKFSHPDLPLFEWVRDGTYRVVPALEWEEAASRRKQVGGRRPAK